MCAGALKDVAPSEKPILGIVHSTQRVIVQQLTRDASVSGEGGGLWLDVLSGKDSLHRCQLRVTIHQLEIAGQLFHTINLASPLHLHGDVESISVSQQQVDRTDRGVKFSFDHLPAIPKSCGVLSEQGLQVRAVDREEAGPGMPLVMTMHRAKGLEFTHVLLLDANALLDPRRRYHETLDETALADWRLRERSLLYVAATRARDVLAVMPTAAR